MQSDMKKPGTPAPEKPAFGQAIACVVALCIMALGAWSLLGQKAPYHPEIYEGDVTRGTSGVTGVTQSN